MFQPFMKAFVTLLALWSIAPALAANMTPIPIKQAHCAAAMKEGAYCYEWALVADPSIRIVSSGYEDGGTFGIYRLSEDGHYNFLATIYPALREKSSSRDLYWGYTWDIKDIAVAVTPEGVIVFRAAFKHKYVGDSPGTASQDRNSPVPFLLFTGKASQLEAKVEGARFVDATIDDLVKNEVAGNYRSERKREP